MITITQIPPEAEEYGMLIPLSATISEGELHIYTLEETYEAARMLDDLVPSAFSREIFDRLDALLRPVMDEMGYEPNDEVCTQCGIILAAESAEQIQKDVIRSDTERYVRKKEHIYFTETALDEESDACTIYATMRGNEVLSFANLNSDDGAVCDIGVETAQGLENCGLATSNVAALALDLLEKGRERILYVAMQDNPASIRVAEKSGFKRVGQEYNYVCFLKEEGAENGI